VRERLPDEDGGERTETEDKEEQKLFHAR
jgi:hypothetical protein